MKLIDERSPDSVTVQQLSIEGIAREAGVSKTTIYRWWPNKADVVIDTFLEHHILATPVREDLPAIEAMREHIVALANVYSGFEGRLMVQLLAEAQYDADTLESFKRHFWRPRREAVARLIERAQAEGSLRDDLQPESIAETIYSPLYFRLLFQEGSFETDAVLAGFDLVMQGAARR